MPKQESKHGREKSGGRSAHAAGRAHEHRAPSPGRTGPHPDARQVEHDGIMVRFSRALMAEVEEVLAAYHDHNGIAGTKRALIEKAVRLHLDRLRAEMATKDVRLQK